MFSLVKNEKILKLNNKWEFEIILCIIFMLFGILGWQINYALGAIPTILLSIALMIIYNKFKYAIPAILELLFSIGTGFSVDQFPFHIVVPVVLFIAFIIFFTIYNFKKNKLKHIKSCIGMIILSISYIIPIFWCTEIDETTTLFYVMYFSWFLYTILFILLCINLDDGAFRITVFAISSLVFLIGYEIITTVIKMHFENPEESILSFWYYIGWGLCNEAGIMLCFIMPFIFYEFIKSNKIYITLFSIFKMLFLLLCIVLTTSRGAILFGGIEFALLSIVLLIIKYDDKKIKLTYFITLCSMVVVVGMAIIVRTNILDNISANIFYDKLGANGREEIYQMGIDSFTKSPRNVIFGSGIVSKIRGDALYHGRQDTFVVYHNSFLEALVSSGIIGTVGLLIHLFEKYRKTFKKGLAFCLIFFIGYFMVDAYGMIDNTYGMYYYMVPLTIVMAAFYHCDNIELFNKTKNELF